MKCPRCLTEQPSGGAVCVRCRINFAEYARREEEALVEDIRPAEGGSNPKKTAANIAIVVAIGVSGAWLFIPTPGKPLTKGAFEHPKCYFAMNPVSGWTEGLGGLGIGACSTNDTVLGKPKIIEAFKMEGPAGESGEKASLSIIVTPQELPALGKTVPPTLWASFPLGLDDYYGMRPSSTEVVEVDGLKSARMTAKAKRLMGGVEREFTLYIVMVPGRQRTYILRGAAEDPGLVARWEVALASFRVTQRPLNYSHRIKRIIDGQLEEKLVGLAIAGILVYFRLLFK